MKRDKAEQIIHNALVGYIEDCAGANSPEAKLIEKAWDVIRLGASPDEIAIHIETDEEYNARVAKIEGEPEKGCSNCDGMELELDEECPDCGRVA